VTGPGIVEVAVPSAFAVVRGLKYGLIRVPLIKEILRLTMRSRDASQKQEESGILWKLILLVLDLRLMGPLSNLIVTLAVVRNSVPKMKGLFLFSLISKITKSTRHFIGKFYVSGVGHDVHIGPLIDEGVHVLKAPYAARYFEIPSDVLLLCYLLLEDRFINRPPRGFAGREFLEKSEHFGHSVIDLLALLENSVLKSFHSFDDDKIEEQAVQNHDGTQNLNCDLEEVIPRVEDIIEFIDHLIDQVIGELDEITLRSHAQDKSLLEDIPSSKRSKYKWLYLSEDKLEEKKGLKLKMTRSVPVFQNVPERTLYQRLHRRNKRVPFKRRDERPEQPRIVYPPIFDINYLCHFLDILENYNPIDDEPMWVVDRVVASTPGSAITIPKIANEFAIKVNHLTLLKGN
nr:hypothetical protein [Tanacetum cinerariifolium]